MRAHQVDGLADRVIGGDRHQVLAADIAKLDGVGILAIGGRPNRDVTVGDDSAELAVLQYKDVTDVVVTHLPRGLDQRRFGLERNRVFSHHLGHCSCHLSGLRGNSYLGRCDTSMPYFFAAALMRRQAASRSDALTPSTWLKRAIALRT